jgi:hypothetical protein
MFLISIGRSNAVQISWPLVVEKIPDGSSVLLVLVIVRISGTDASTNSNSPCHSADKRTSSAEMFTVHFGCSYPACNKAT